MSCMRFCFDDMHATCGRDRLSPPVTDPRSPALDTVLTEVGVDREPARTAGAAAFSAGPSVPRRRHPATHRRWSPELYALWLRASGTAIAAAATPPHTVSNASVL